MAELGSHQLDVANRVLGRPPARVMATGGIDYWRDGREVFDNVFCIYEYELPVPEVKARRRGAAARQDQNAADSAKPSKDTYTVRVTYSSLQNNAYQGASELIMGTKGTLFLTQKKGLYYRERLADNPGWDPRGRGEVNATIITSGKTLKMTNDPWAHRGKPYEIDTSGDDTRAELVAFLKSAAEGNPNTICNAQIGLEDAATVLAANESARAGRPVEIAATLNAVDVQSG